MTTALPVGKRVVLRVVEREKYKGSLHIPDTGKDKPATGEILAVGKDCLAETGVDLQQGDVVYFARYAGHFVTVDGEEVLIIGMSDILAVLLND